MSEGDSWEVVDASASSSGAAPPATSAGSAAGELSITINIRLRQQAGKEKEVAVTCPSVAGATSGPAASTPAPPPAPADGPCHPPHHVKLYRPVQGPPAAATEPPTTEQQPEVMYVVTRNPGNPLATGLWQGSKAKTWKTVLLTLQGRKLFGSGAKLRKVKSVEEAWELWAMEHAGGVERSLPVRTVPP